VVLPGFALVRGTGTEQGKPTLCLVVSYSDTKFQSTIPVSDVALVCPIPEMWRHLGKSAFSRSRS
jgi:hypothetical protein